MAQVESMQASAVDELATEDPADSMKSLSTSSSSSSSSAAAAAALTSSLSKQIVLNEFDSKMTAIDMFEVDVDYSTQLREAKDGSGVVFPGKFWFKIDSKI